MAMISLGDMARHFVAQRDMHQLRSRLTTLTQEVSQERTADPTRHLQGRSDRLVMLDHKISALTGEVKMAETLGHRLQTAQTALTQIDKIRSTLSERLLGLPTATTEKSLAEAGALAEGALRDIFGALAVRHGADHLFSGRASDRAPLAPVEDMVQSLRAQAAGAASFDDLAAIADHFFTDPAGSFAMSIYQADTGPAETRDLGQGMQVALGPRADDPALRKVFAALATAMLQGESKLPVAGSTRSEAMQHVGAGLVDAAAGLAGLTARLGMNENLVDQVVAARSAGLAAAQIMRNEMIGIDQAKAVSTLQQLQAQLEIQYTITGRLASLSLAGYLR